MSLFAELRRRNVILVAFAYATIGWLLLELAGMAVGHFTLPEWIHRFLAAVLLICFPLALIFSWIYEITPQGLKREFEVARDQSITHSTGRRLRRVTLVSLLLIIAINLFRALTT